MRKIHSHSHSHSQFPIPSHDSEPTVYIHIFIFILIYHHSTLILVRSNILPCFKNFNLLILIFIFLQNIFSFSSSCSISFFLFHYHSISLKFMNVWMNEWMNVLQVKVKSTTEGKKILFSGKSNETCYHVFHDYNNACFLLIHWNHS